jgi:Phosphotyrosyl phosphate activator (PTPA) protein
MTEYHSRIPEFPHDAIPEVSGYLQQAFGDRERIDYGSGHELNFMCWLYFFQCNSNRRLCLRQLNILSQDDFQSLILVVFNKSVPGVPSDLDTSPSLDESKPCISSNQQAPMAYGVLTTIPSSHISSVQANSSTTLTSVRNPSTQPKQ